MNESQNRTDETDSRSSRSASRPKPVLRDTAYRKFMDYLMSGELRPGLLVSQRELCESTDTTIGAMREALKRLEAEGIITLIPQRGVMVREPDEREINDVYETRKIFEAYAAQIYAESGDLDKIAEIKEQSLEVLNRKVETREESARLSRERLIVDDLLHQTLIGNLNIQLANEIFDKLRIQIQVTRLGVQPRFVDSRPALREHLVVIEALEKRDGKAAAQAMIEHLEGGRRRAVGID